MGSRPDAEAEMMQVWASLVLGLVNVLLIPDGAYFGSFQTPLPRSSLRRTALRRRSFAGITESFSKFSRRDAAALPEWRVWLGRSADNLRPMLMETPVNVRSMALGDFADQARFAFRHRRGMSSGAEEVPARF